MTQKFSSEERMNTQIRHIFFGSETSMFAQHSRKKNGHKNAGCKELRYPEDEFSRIMIGNGSAGFPCSIAKNKAYGKFIGPWKPIFLNSAT